MAKYVYPALFHKEKDGGYSISFPDIENCVTCGDDLSQGIEMASDVLPLMLSEFENDNKEIPTPSTVKDILTGDDEFVTMIACDTEQYRQQMNRAVVKKAVTA